MPLRVRLSEGLAVTACGEREQGKFFPLDRCDSTPECQALCVCREDQQVTLVDALGAKTCGRVAQEPTAETLPSVACGDDQVMNETSTAVVSAEDGSDKHALLTGNIAQTWIAQEKALDRFAFVSFTEAYAFS